MSAYVIGTYDLTDPEKYGRYVQVAVPLVFKHGGKALVAGGIHENVEGSRSVVVVLEFPDLKAAHAWHDDPEYQAVIHLRHEATENSFLAFSDTFVMPG